MKHLAQQFAHKLRAPCCQARLLLAACCLAGLAACTPGTNDPAAGQGVEDLSDAARLADLQALAAAIRDWYASHGELPASIGAVSFEFGLELQAPDGAYDYEILGAEDYQLCTDFDSALDATRGGNEWQHGAGRHCYRLSPTFAQY